MLKYNFCLKLNVLFHPATRPSPGMPATDPLCLVQVTGQRVPELYAPQRPAYKVSLSHLYFISAKHSISHEPPRHPRMAQEKGPTYFSHRDNPEYNQRQIH